jgi:hypothetical protein
MSLWDDTPRSFWSFWNAAVRSRLIDGALARSDLAVGARIAVLMRHAAITICKAKEIPQATATDAVLPKMLPTSQVKAVRAISRLFEKGDSDAAVQRLLHDMEFVQPPDLLLELSTMVFYAISRMPATDPAVRRMRNAIFAGLTTQGSIERNVAFRHALANVGMHPTCAQTDLMWETALKRTTGNMAEVEQLIRDGWKPQLSRVPVLLRLAKRADAKAGPQAAAVRQYATLMLSRMTVPAEPARERARHGL